MRLLEYKLNNKLEQSEETECKSFFLINQVNSSYVYQYFKYVKRVKLI